MTDLLHRGEPCTSCGLRFTEDQRDAYQQHLDWHYQENRMDKEGTRGMMRNWYLRPDVSGGKERGREELKDKRCYLCFVSRTG